jgi:uncharacterized protein YbjT (DUF2867 family)
MRILAMSGNGPILVTGATGYVGGRLIPQLLQAGWEVRAMVRTPAKLTGRPWAGHPDLEIAAADVLDTDSLNRAVRGCLAIYYLIHSMNDAGRDYAGRDRRAAHTMVEAAARGGVARIIYLGGLGGEGAVLSPHLRSRHEVAQILRSGPVPVTYLRSGIILGSGSASFEILRYLVDRLPVMITPRWVETACQPIAIRDVLYCLVGCLDHEETVGKTLEIGGPDVITYRRLMEIYAEEANLRKRLIIPVPVLTPRLSSYWIHLVTPVHASIARPLVQGLATPVVCKDTRILAIMPRELTHCRDAIRYALDRIGQHQVETHWTDAGITLAPEWLHRGDAPYAGGTVLSCAYRIQLEASPEEVWRPICEIGGERGWYFGNVLWALRGWMDRLAGGVGLRRGRRDPRDLKAGDAVDFWRVVEVEPPGRLLLAAEMKLPGEALLEFRVLRRDDGRTELQQISRFLPRGLWGILYWYALYPVHTWLFRGMLRSIARTVGAPVVLGPVAFDPKQPPRGRL